MHSLRLLLYFMPILLVEPGRVPRTRRLAAIVPLDRRLTRREEGRAPGRTQQQHELVPMPHDSQLLADMPQGTEPCLGDCRDQEEHGFHLKMCEGKRWDFHSLYVHVMCLLHLQLQLL
jgi:hypothetical protein